MIAHALGLVATGDVPALDALVDHLRDADLLLIIDTSDFIGCASPVS